MTWQEPLITFFEDGAFSKRNMEYEPEFRSKLRFKSHTSHVTTGKILQHSASVSASVKQLMTSKDCCKDQIG